MHWYRFQDTMNILLMIWIAMIAHASTTQVRVITWNVADNSKMNDGYTDTAMDKVLGLDTGDALADIYAIGLQENCWECNEGSFKKIGKKFLDRISRKDSNYEVVHIEGTRESSWCEFGCNFGSHGSTILVVIAKKDLEKSHDGFHRNDDCSDSTPQNDEKGVAAIKIKLKDGRRVCFATSHLESGDSKTRRECLRLFFKDADEEDWDDCDFQFLSGDFNTRTGDKMSDAPDDGKFLNPTDSSIAQLKTKDELVGSNPYGTDSSWKDNLLAYINRVQGETFKEAPVTFAPTYSIRPSLECEGRKTCYRESRPVSWTDRIIYTKGNIIKYGSIVEYYSDHFPVYAVYSLD